MTTRNRRQRKQQLPLDAFPIEIICEIMSYLEFDSLISISRPCKLFRDIADKYFDRQKVVELARKLKKYTKRHFQCFYTNFTRIQHTVWLSWFMQAISRLTYYSRLWIKAKNLIKWKKDVTRISEKMHENGR
jgi:hypothetical protein